jgi:hypothetical protein
VMELEGRGRQTYLRLNDFRVTNEL